MRTPKDKDAVGTAVADWLATEDNDDTMTNSLEVVLREQGVLTGADSVDEIVCEDEACAVVILASGEILVVDQFGAVVSHPLEV